MQKVGASGARPILGVQQDAPTIETIVLLTFYEVIMNSRRLKHRGPARKAKVSLARALSKAGYCSRSKALDLIREGRVQLNGTVVRNSETRLDMNLDRLEADGRTISAAGKIYLVLNKPRGLVVTSSDEKGRETVYDCLAGGNFPWLAPVGRLDKASEGLLLLTNDNRWAADILDPQTHVEKTYHVPIDRIADENLILLRQFAKSPLFPLAKGGNCYPPLWPPAHRASLRGMSPSGAEPDLEGKEGRGEIF